MLYVLEDNPHMELAAGPACDEDFLPFSFADNIAVAAE